MWINFDLFNQVPSNIAVIDKKYSIIDANKSFADTFGAWQGKKCYEVYKNRKTKCKTCFASKTFKDGKTRTSEEEGRDLKGNLNYYLVNLSPYRDSGGSITHIIEMSTDITDRVKIQHEYMTIFDNVPCFITVIDKNFKVIKSNKFFKKKFGNNIGTYCYESYKKRDKVCTDCTAKQVFADGKMHRSLQEGYDIKGKKVYYIVTSTPYSVENGRTDYVIEMAIDVTKTFLLEKELKESYDFQHTIIQNAIDGIIATNEEGIVNIYNPSAKNILKYPKSKILGKMSEKEIYPKEVLKNFRNDSSALLQREGNLPNHLGKEIPIVYSGVNLIKDNRNIGKVIFFQDMSSIKQLESEKLEAERLAAVGQTVAGLAHGIKNILMGLEGGMYVVNSGMRRNNNKLVSQGWEMLQGNVEKISSFAKEFLSFARGTKIEAEMTRPADIAHDIIHLFKDTIKKAKIKITTKIDDTVAEAPMDQDGIHACLANLISNAIDACLMSNTKKPEIRFTMYEKRKTIYFEVSDNGCGMDYEVKKKVFTSFFSTKGSDKGTGLGLLTTKKLVSEHGGKVVFNSTLGKGSMFKLEFPRSRLPLPQEESKI